MSGIALPLTLTALFVALNGFFVAAEFALVKARPSRIRARAKKGSRSAQVASHILSHLELYLSGCQLGITAASLVLGWLAEPAVARLLIMGVDAAGLHVDEGVLHVVALVFALTVVTMLHMIFGEQAPKIWAIRTADRTAIATAYPLRIFVGALRPAIWAINVLSNLVLRLVGIRSGASEEVTHDVGEIRAIVARSAEEGFLSRRQGELAQNILTLAGLEVRHILVPRVDVVALSIEDSAEESLATLKKSAHSRLPLCEDGLDGVQGIVHAKDVLRALIEGEEVDLAALARPAAFVPETQSLPRLIGELQTSKNGCAVVVDERGTALGLAFLEDALEEIVGPIQDEFDGDHAPAPESPGPGVHVLPGSMPLPEAQQLLDLDELAGADTIGGLVICELGRMPRAGDTVRIGSLEATVEAVSRKRVTRVRLEEVVLDEGGDEADGEEQ